MIALPTLAIVGGAMALPLLLDVVAPVAGAPTNEVIPERHAPGFDAGMAALQTTERDMGAWFAKFRATWQRIAGVAADGQPDISPAQMRGWLNIQLAACDASGFALGVSPPFEGQLRSMLAFGDTPAASVLNDYGKAFVAAVAARRSLGDDDGAWPQRRAAAIVAGARLCAEFDGVGSGIGDVSFLDSLVDSAGNLPETLSDAAGDAVGFVGDKLLSAVGNVAFSTPVLLGAFALVWWRYVR